MASDRIEQGFDAATRGAAFLRRAPYACVRATGADALDLLHRLSTNDLRRLRAGQVARTILTNEKGRMIDLVTVAVLEDGLLLLVSRGNEHHLQRWIEKYTITEDISLAGLSKESELACIVGPRALESAAALVGRAVPADGIAVVQDGRRRLTVVTASARWGWDVYLVSVGDADDGDHVLEDRCRDAGITVISRDAFECARISRARPAFGSEISESYTPHDAGLAEFISTTKGCYIGQEVLARMVTYQKGRKGLIGFTSALPLPETGGRALLFKDDVEVGVLTSSSPRPVYGRSLGLGIVRTDLVSLGDTVAVGEPDADFTCRIVPLPIELSPA
jgi:tRNA-modifying protein YgfZ